MEERRLALAGQPKAPLLHLLQPSKAEVASSVVDTPGHALLNTWAAIKAVIKS